MSQPIDLLLVDGHHRVRKALADRLRRMPGVGRVTEASAFAAAIQLAHAHAPHVVLFDPRTVEGGAAETVRLLGQEGRRVVVFTSSLLDDEAAVLAAAGATTIAFKGMPTATLLALLRSLVDVHHDPPAS